VLADPARRTRPWHEAKWRALPDGGALTLGADAKLRWEAVDRPLFGIAGAEADSYLLHRVMLHADWRPNRHVQGFVQLAHHDSQGRSGFFPLDRGGLDLQQAFLELRGGAGERTQSLRLGRQEMAFSPRFVNPRDGVNIRSAYDGARGWVVRGPGGRRRSPPGRWRTGRARSTTRATRGRRSPARGCSTASERSGPGASRRRSTGSTETWRGSVPSWGPTIGGRGD
jgi:hypothetical protein